MILPEIQKIAVAVKQELTQWRETFSYCEIEVFIGCLLINLLQRELITPEEEKFLRKFLLEK